MTFGERLKLTRKANFVRQQQLAEHLNVAVSTLSQYENDKRHPNFDILCDIADYFHVTTDYLIGKTNSPTHTNVIFKEIDADLNGLSYEKLLNKISDNLKYMYDAHDQKSIEILYKIYDSIASISIDQKKKLISGDMEYLLNNHMNQKEIIDTTLNKLFRHHLKFYS
ncbi:MAG: helix-turn-helix transcriptional regulator [Clostridia bacterium]|nr:helix-turn-helix transcriptional regulator [Clostridia bacterium]